MVLGALVLSMLFGAAAGFVAQLLFWGSIRVDGAPHAIALYPKIGARRSMSRPLWAWPCCCSSVWRWQAALIPIAFVAVPWLRSKLAAQQAQPATVQDEAEHDDVVIFIPVPERRKVAGKKYGEECS